MPQRTKRYQLTSVGKAIIKYTSKWFLKMPIATLGRVGPASLPSSTTEPTPLTELLATQPQYHEYRRVVPITHLWW